VTPLLILRFRTIGPAQCTRYPGHLYRLCRFLYPGYSKVIIDTDEYCMWERVGTKSFTVFLILFLLTLAFGFNGQLARSDSAAESEGTVVRVIPEIIEFEGVDVVGQTFLVAVVVENVTDLSGLYTHFCWNTTYLQFLSYTETIPVEDYPTPYWPSPYPGILHGPFIYLPGSGGDGYRIAIASWGASFNGSGTVVVIHFQVKRQPQPYEEDAVFNFRFDPVHLTRSTAAGGGDIPHSVVEGTVIIHTFPTHELSVVSIPFTSIPFTIDGEDERTPYRTTLPQDSYVLEVPATHNQLLWSHWLEDGDTNRTKTILLDADTTLTAVYTPLIGGETVSIESEQLSSWLAPTLLVAAFFFVSGIYLRRRHV